MSSCDDKGVCVMLFTNVGCKGVEQKSWKLESGKLRMKAVSQGIYKRSDTKYFEKQEPEGAGL